MTSFIAYIKIDILTVYVNVDCGYLFDIFTVYVDRLRNDPNVTAKTRIKT